MLATDRYEQAVRQLSANFPVDAARGQQFLGADPLSQVVQNVTQQGPSAVADMTQAARDASRKLVADLSVGVKVGFENARQNLQAFLAATYQKGVGQAVQGSTPTSYVEDHNVPNGAIAHLGNAHTHDVSLSVGVTYIPGRKRNPAVCPPK